MAVEFEHLLSILDVPDCGYALFTSGGAELVIRADANAVDSVVVAFKVCLESVVLLCP